MNRILIFTLLSFFIYFNSYAQGKTDAMLLGEVKSIKTKEHLAYATITVKGTNIGTTADNTGHFKLVNLPLGKNIIVANLLGYKPQEKEVFMKKDEAITLFFELEEDVFSLSEVSVLSKQSVSYTEEIDNEFLSKIQAVDIKDIFAYIPSVTVGGGGANAQRIYLRGIEGSNLNITIDGAKQGRSLFQHRGNVSNVDPGLLKKVNIATGADASQSSGALGGSIAFETIDAQDLAYNHGKVGGKLSIGAYSAQNGYTTSGIIGGKLSSSIGLLAAVSHNDLDAYRAPNYGIIPYTGGKNQNVFVKLSMLDMKAHNLRFSGTYNINSGHYITGGNGSDMGIPDTSRTAAKQKMTRSTYTMDYRYNPESPWLNIHANAYYNRRNLNNESANLDVTSNNIGASVKNIFNVDLGNLKNKFTIGFDYDNEDGLSAPTKRNANQLGADEINNTSRVFGAFAQGVSEISILSFTYGGRLDSYDSNFGPNNDLKGNSFSPNAGIAIEPIRGLHVYGNYKEAIRATGIIPIQWMANIVDGANINNGKPFAPELSIMFDGGIRFSKSNLFMKNDKLTFNGKIFKSKIENLIEVLSGGRRGTPITGIRNDSLGVVSNGYELSLGWENRTFKTLLRFIHVDIKDGDGNHIQVTRRKAAPAGDRFNWTTSWQIVPELEFGYALNAVSKLKDVYKTARPGYATHNVQIVWSPQAVKGLTSSIAVNNIFNKEYSEQTSIELGEAIIPEVGRDIRVTVTYNF